LSFILDTNVISAVRRAEMNPGVAAWLAAQTEADLFLSVVTLGEIERGIHLQRGRNPEFADDLKIWLDRTVMLFADRILPFTAADARVWGALSARIGHSGANLMIAAQGIARDARIVTRNTSDFEPTGVGTFNPF